MKIYFIVGAVLPAAMLISSSARAAETKVAMKDLPVPVQNAIKEHSQGAAIRGLSKEIENGKPEYEAELTVNGHSKDISFDAAGNVTSVEEEVQLESLPEAARAAIQKDAEGGTLRKVEAVTEGGKSFYEATIRKGSRTKEIQVSSNGARIK